MIVLAVMFLCHFIADFLMQSRDMGKKKSTDFSILLKHIGIQWIVLTIGLWCFMDLVPAYELSALNAVVHGLIDWNIWRGYKLLVMKRIDSNPSHPLVSGTYGTTGQWMYYEDHWFYATIGLDQLLHSLTLIAIAGAFL